MTKQRGIEQAQCPDCLGWFDIEWQDEIPPGGYWWVNSGCCPGCGVPALIETECEFRQKEMDPR
jgi:hypothetical protein